MRWVRQKSLVISVLCCLLVLSWPVDSYAVLGLSFDIISLGPLSLGFDIPLDGGAAAGGTAAGGALALLGGILLVGAMVAFFSGSGSASYAGYAGPAPPVITKVRLTVKPDEHYRGEPLRMKFHDVIKDSKLPLANGAYLEVMDDGRMVFRNAAFEGFALLHFDRTISVWGVDDNIVAVLTVNEDRLLVVQEKSDRAGRVVKALLGGAK